MIRPSIRVATLGIALACAPAFAQISVTDPLSKHNLSTSGPLGGTTGTNEVCVFCHTPHGADTTAAAPLWNRTLANPGGFQRYSDLQTATLDGAEAPVGSVSLACLSCHDGTQARDTVINSPGSGTTGDTGTGRGNMPTGILANLGTDLRNDHPVSIEYAGGACRGVVAGTPGNVNTCDPSTGTGTTRPGDPDFNAAKATTINGLPQWWVDVGSFPTDADGNVIETGTVDVREKTDMLLYYRTDFVIGQDQQGGAITADGPSIECGSCHDPHDATPRAVQFLRISNARSSVCLACHIK